MAVGVVTAGDGARAVDEGDEADEKDGDGGGGDGGGGAGLLTVISDRVL